MTMAELLKDEPEGAGDGTWIRFVNALPDGQFEIISEAGEGFCRVYRPELMLALPRRRKELTDEDRSGTSGLP